MANDVAGKSPAGQKPMVRIEYCTSEGISPEPPVWRRMLHDYQEQLRGVTIAPGDGIVRSLLLNRRKVFSKNALDRFPEVNEVEEKIGELVGA